MQPNDIETIIARLRAWVATRLDAPVEPMQPVTTRHADNGTLCCVTWLLGLAARDAETVGSIGAFDRAEAEHEALVARAATGDLAKRHRDAWLAARWS